MQNFYIQLKFSSFGDMLSYVISDKKQSNFKSRGLLTQSGTFEPYVPHMSNISNIDRRLRFTESWEPSIPGTVWVDVTCKCLMDQIAIYTILKFPHDHAVCYHSITILLHTIDRVTHTGIFGISQRKSSEQWP